METSAKANINVEKAFMTLAEDILKKVGVISSSRVRGGRFLDFVHCSAPTKLVAALHCIYIYPRAKQFIPPVHLLVQACIIMVLARDPSTRLLDGLFHLWTGKKKN